MENEPPTLRCPFCNGQGIIMDPGGCYHRNRSGHWRLAVFISLLNAAVWCAVGYLWGLTGGPK